MKTLKINMARLRYTGLQLRDMAIRSYAIAVYRFAIAGYVRIYYYIIIRITMQVFTCRYQLHQI